MRQLSIKINQEEYDYLRNLPGKSTNAKLRNLLHQEAISAEISKRVSEQLSGQIREDMEAMAYRLEQMEQNISSMSQEISSISQSEQEVDTRLVQLGKEIRRLRKDLGKEK
jgi:archaellum component FlaC